MDDKFLKKAFDIGGIPEDIDLSSPPVSGFDYLYRVRLETRKCPKVVVSNIDPSKYIPRQNVRVEFFSGFIRAAPGFEPDRKWTEQQIMLFTRYRDRLQKNRATLRSKFPKRDCPKLNQEEDWCLYCLGRQKFEEIYGNPPASDDTNPSSRKKSRFSNKRNPPLLSILVHMNQNYVTTLLGYHINWLQETRFSDEHGEWLYALLACLEKPLDPDTCSLLRSLSRVCSSLRSSLSDPEDQALKPLNSIICIICEIFDQKDMSDYFSYD